MLTSSEKANTFVYVLNKEMFCVMKKVLVEFANSEGLVNPAQLHTGHCLHCSLTESLDTAVFPDLVSWHKCRVETTISFNPYLVVFSSYYSEPSL